MQKSFLAKYAWASPFNVTFIFLLWHLTGLIPWLIYLFLSYLNVFYYLAFHFLGGYNHGPCGCEVGFVTFWLLRLASCSYFFKYILYRVTITTTIRTTNNNYKYDYSYNYVYQYHFCDSVIKATGIINVGVQCLVYERTCQWHENSIHSTTPAT